MPVNRSNRAWQRQISLAIGYRWGSHEARCGRGQRGRGKYSLCTEVGMSRLLRKCVASVALAFLPMTVSALAADMPVKSSAPLTKVAAPPSWGGCYVGLHGGYGWGDAKDQTATNTPRNLDPTGYFAGGQVGCNWQWQPQWVLGVEADLAGANISETKSFTGGGQPTIEEKIDRLATIRARAGFVSGQNLLYVTGGWGWADTSRHVRLAGLGGNPFQTLERNLRWLGVGRRSGAYDHPELDREA